MSKYKKPMTPEEIAQVEDSDIDFSDIPQNLMPIFGTTQQLSNQIPHSL